MTWRKFKIRRYLDKQAIPCATSMRAKAWKNGALQLFSAILCLCRSKSVLEKTHNVHFEITIIMQSLKERQNMIVCSCMKTVYNYTPEKRISSLYLTFRCITRKKVNKPTMTCHKKISKIRSLPYKWNCPALCAQNSFSRLACYMSHVTCVGPDI